MDLTATHYWSFAMLIVAMIKLSLDKGLTIRILWGGARKINLIFKVVFLQTCKEKPYLVELWQYVEGFLFAFLLFTFRAIGNSFSV